MVPGADLPAKGSTPTPQRMLELLRLLYGEPAGLTLTRETSALLVIDVQRSGTDPKGRLATRASEKGVGRELDYYWDRLRELTIPNIQRLLDQARRSGIEVIHIRTASLTKDGRDRSRRHSHMSLSPPTSATDAEFLPEAEPVGDEIVLSKTTSSAFNSTVIDRLLRNMGIRNVFVAGVVTNGCVESTVHGATEHDYGVVVAENACATFSPQVHDVSLLNMAYRAHIKPTQDIISTFEAVTGTESRPMGRQAGRAL